MKKVLIVHPDLSGGGAGKVLVNVLNEIDYEKYKITLLLEHKSGVYIGDINKNVNIKYIHDPCRYRNTFLKKLYCKIMMILFEDMPRILHKLIVGNKYDIEIAFLEGESTKFISSSGNKKSIKIAWNHTDVSKYSLERIRKEEQYYENIDNIILVSNNAKKSFDKTYPQYSHKSSVIYNLINESEIIEKSDEFLVEKDEYIYIVAVGRLIEEKRFDILLKAYKSLLSEGIKVKLLIVGSGKLEKKLKKLIVELQISDSVEMIGFTKNPYPYIKSADIFVSTSDFEGFSLVLCEAMILEKPIIATKSEGALEILDYGKYGMLVEKDNYNELKDCLKKVIVNNSLLNELKDKSRVRSKEFYKNNSINKINELFL